MNPHLQARPESFILRIAVKHLGEHMTTLRPSRADDGAALVDLWRRAVDATHDFLSAEDRQAIDAEVAGFLPQAPMTVAVAPIVASHGPSTLRALS